MEFRIAKVEFLRGLRLAQGIADRKSTMPMLANVLLRTQGKNQLLVAATDLNVSLTAELKSTNASEGGITLGAKNLHELIANAPGDEITGSGGARPSSTSRAITAPAATPRRCACTRLRRACRARAPAQVRSSEAHLRGARGRHRRAATRSASLRSGGSWRSPG